MTCSVTRTTSLPSALSFVRPEIKPSPNTPSAILTNRSASPSIVRRPRCPLPSREISPASRSLRPNYGNGMTDHLHLLENSHDQAASPHVVGHSHHRSL